MEDSFYKGAIPSKFDLRDDWYSPVGRGLSDWDYDIEKVIGKKLVTKDQGKSSSCGGQAWSYYGEVLEAIATKTYEPLSARWIYSHTRVPSGGSAGRVNCDFVVKEGFVRERQAPSYEAGNPPSETFMSIVPELSKKEEGFRDVSRSASYLQVKSSFEEIAQAVTQNSGCIIMVGAQNNGTWKNQFPLAPKTEEWWHWLYVGKLVIKNGKKYLGVKNSWGNAVGENGWQYLDESFVPHIREVWTFSWDYERPKLKKVLQTKVTLLRKVVELMNQLINLKK